MNSAASPDLDIVTKKAWEENWRDVTIEQALETLNYPRVREHIDIFKRYLPREGKILEGGCGLGTYLIHFKSLGYNIVGVDYNKEPLSKISKYDTTIPLYCADVRDLPCADNFFEAYLSLGVIEHFSEGPLRAIEEARRILSGGGHFIVQVPYRSIFHKIKIPIEALKRNSLLRLLFKKQSKRYYWEQYFKISDLEALLEKCGFEILRTIPVDQEHSLMTFSGLFRDKNSYDGPSKLGVWLGRFCRAHMPRMTASGIIIICRKV